MTNIKEVAKECGVSVATVSRVFSGSDPVRPETRESVLAAARRLGYSPNILARGLKKSRTQTVGIIVPSIDNSFYLGILKEIESILRKHGYRMLVSFLQHGGTSEREAIALMASSRVDALVFSPRDRSGADLIGALKETTELFQLFTDTYEEIDSVTVDDAGGVYEAVKLLLENGHRRILYVGGDPRAAGYSRAFSEAGLTADEGLISLDWSVSEEDIRRMLVKRQPTAVLSIAGLSEKVWCAVRSLSLNVPEQLSMIVYDDSVWARLLGITAVAHPLGEIAEKLCERIFYRLEETDTPLLPENGKVSVSPFLINRGSVSRRRDE